MYLDLYALVNFLSDYIALFFCGRIMSRKTKRSRLVFGALFSTCYALTETLIKFGWVSPVLRLAVIPLTVRISYGKSERKVFVKLCFSYFFALIILGGSMYGISEFFMLFNDNIRRSYGIFIFVLAIFIYFQTLFEKIFKTMTGGSEVTLSFKFAGSDIRLGAFADSGNMLRDKKTGKKVVLVKASALEKIDEILLETEKLTPIPYRMQGVSGVIYAFLPDSGEVRRGNKISMDDFLIGIDFQKGTFGGFLALVPDN